MQKIEAYSRSTGGGLCLWASRPPSLDVLLWRLMAPGTFGTGTGIGAGTLGGRGTGSGIWGGDGAAGAGSGCLATKSVLCFCKSTKRERERTFYFPQLGNCFLLHSFCFGKGQNLCKKTPVYYYFFTHQTTASPGRPNREMSVIPHIARWEESKEREKGWTPYCQLIIISWPLFL